MTIVDDTASPQMEGNETFIVYLSSAMGSGLATPSEALVVINDTVDDSKSHTLNIQMPCSSFVDFTFHYLVSAYFTV